MRGLAAAAVHLPLLLWHMVRPVWRSWACTEVQGGWRRHLAPGCVLLFDELFNYGGYKENEVKALYEWLKASQRKVQVIGMLGPLDGRTTAVDLNTGEDLGWVHQSAAFKVL